MTYLTWVESVLHAAVTVAEADQYRGSIGVGVGAIANELGVGMDDLAVQGALYTAGQDLDSLGVIEHEDWLFRVQPTAIKIVRAGGLRTEWPNLFRGHRPLAEDLEVLGRVVAASEVEQDKWADLRRIELKDVLEEMGREATQPAANAIANRLYLDNCLARPILTIGWCTVWPSYIGVIVATQRDISEQEQVVRQLATDWETTSVDVKELLQLIWKE